MARTTFSGPVASENGFEGPLEATNLSATGVVTFSDLPTTDPEVAGQLWNNEGVLTVSGGPA